MQVVAGGITGAAHLPALLFQLVILIVGLVCPQRGGRTFLLLAGNQTANGVIGVQIGNGSASIGFRYAVEIAFTVTATATQID